MPCREMVAGGRRCARPASAGLCEEHADDRALFNWCHTTENRSEAAYLKISPFNPYLNRNNRKAAS